ncbi:MAG: hypothetical protein WC307_04765 [Candidatus Nanoarchaeia archaeon]|jgi:gas vesicle protein
MGLFRKKAPKEELINETVNKMIIGINPELVSKVRDKVTKLKEEKEYLKHSYDDLIKRMAMVEGKCDAIDSTFKNFKDDLMSNFLVEARKELKKELGSVNESIKANQTRATRNEDELMKLIKKLSDAEFVSSFQDDYQSIKLCIYMITNSDPSNHSLIVILLQTIHSVIDEMRRNGYWTVGREAVLTSLLNLKTYWRGRDERVEALIGSEIDALENLR